MTRVRTGLDRLSSDEAGRIRGRRIGLLAHHASFTSDLVFAADALSRAGAEVVRLLGPEHGPWGTVQDMVGLDDGRDPWTGLDLVSLYGRDLASLRPSPDALAGLDALVIDLQDVGARYYTYAATAAMAVEVAAEVGIEAIVCDRPNPLGGGAPEGNRVETGLRSFVGMYDAPQRHGLTLGELVHTYTGGMGTLIPMEGWSREHWFDQTGLPWIPPSPNMPTLTTAAVYPGLCLLEGTTLSEGRGTTTPFEVFGAPWVDPFRLARALQAKELPGVAFRPHVFLPTFQKHAGIPCGGVQIVIRDRRRMRPVALGVEILCTLRALWPEHLRWRTETYEFVSDRLAIDLLLGAAGAREAIEAGEDARTIMADWPGLGAAFWQRSAPWRRAEYNP